MLPAGCAQRLISLFTECLENCAEERQRLEQNLKRCQAVLGDWNSQVPESPPHEDSKQDKQESEISVKDLEELELLNNALQKALRIRTKFQQAPGASTESTRAVHRNPITRTAIKPDTDDAKGTVPKSARVSSGKGRPRSSQKPTAYVLKAPYRTDPDVKRLPMKTGPRLNSRAPRTPGKKKSPKEAMTTKATLPAKVTQRIPEEVDTAEGVGKQLGPARSPACEKPKPSPKNLTGGGDSMNAEPSLSTAGHAGLGLVTQPGCSTVTVTTPQISTLQERGPSLKLPLPFKKAFSRYTRLREECGLCQTSPEAAAARNRFMGKLEATFCSPTPAFSPAEVTKELKNLQYVYALVKQCMEAESTASMESTAWEKKYEHLLTLEGLQAIVAQSLDKADQLREAMESYSKLFPACGPCREGCLPGGCSSLGWPTCGAEETIGLPPPLLYSSLEELSHMEALNLQVRMLRQRLDIQKAMEAELLPLLEAEPSDEGSRTSLFRAVYSLLCEEGEHFPVLVRDEEPPDCAETENGAS